MIEPDLVPNAIGRDPWITAIDNSIASADVAGEDVLAAFLFCRAMGRRSRSQGRLFFHSVQRLHEASAANRLLSSAQYLVERRLPDVPFWREWDRCERIRRAVVDKFLDRDLPPWEFETVVDDDKLWSDLVYIAADSSRGRRFLERVSRSLRDGLNEASYRRGQIINREIG